MSKFPPPLGDMPPEEFLTRGHEIIEWAGDYFAHPERWPVQSRNRPGDVRRQLPATPPEAPEGMEEILADFRRVILPGMTLWNHPGFLGFFSISGSGPAIHGELLASILSPNGMVWRTSPAVAELDEVVCDWLRQMLTLPGKYRGILYDYASTATMAALTVAREQVPGLRARELGLAGRPEVAALLIYCCEHAHSSVEKAALQLGIGLRNVVKVQAVGGAGGMDVADLARKVAAHRAAGLTPIAVVATAGCTPTGAIDPLAPIAALCRREKLWLHVDGAYGFAFGLVPELRGAFAGIEQADSIVCNPHKILYCPLECSALFVRRPEAFRDTFSLVPPYLRTDEVGVINYNDYGPQLSRRFRSLKLWFVLRYFGRRGLVERLREHVRLARLFAGWVEKADDFELLHPPALSTLCFRAHPEGLDEGPELDRLNRELLDRVNASGEVLLSGTDLWGSFALRLSVGHIRTSEREVERAWALLQEECAQLAREYAPAAVRLATP
jgi:aromatic-L-amino-acid/L-tryptophan decarboxylase